MAKQLVDVPIVETSPGVFRVLRAPTVGENDRAGKPPKDAMYLRINADEKELADHLVTSQEIQGLNAFNLLKLGQKGFACMSVADFARLKRG